MSPALAIATATAKTIVLPRFNTPNEYSVLEDIKFEVSVFFGPGQISRR